MIIVKPDGEIYSCFKKGEEGAGGKKAKAMGLGTWLSSMLRPVLACFIAVLYYLLRSNLSASWLK
jgi:hypothetical protein